MTEIKKFNFPKKIEEESLGDFEVFENENMRIQLEKVKINCGERKEKAIEIEEAKPKKVGKMGVCYKWEDYREELEENEEKRKAKIDKEFEEFLREIDKINNKAA
jgi:hypothetical protein